MAGGGRLPGDIVEEILSYLPVKSLLRFKYVSKSWCATISDVSFAGTHIRRRREMVKINWQHSRLVGPGSSQPQMTEFTKEQLLSDLPILPQPYSKLCEGDGLTVGHRRLNSFPKFGYALWNPSTRSLLEFEFPNYFTMMSKRKRSVSESWIDHLLFGYENLLFGLGYDSSINEYKFVICNGVQYVIFYCTKNCWSEIKNVDSTFMMPLGMSWSHSRHGFFSNGHFYWYFINNQSLPCIEVVCFDAMEEKVKRLPDPLPPCPITEGDRVWARIVPCKDSNLALYYRLKSSEKILVLKSGDSGEYSWTTVIDDMPQFPSPYLRKSPSYLALEDEIIVFNSKVNKRCPCSLAYNRRTQTFTEIPYHPFRGIVFRENLFFSSSENGGKWRTMD